MFVVVVAEVTTPVLEYAFIKLSRIHTKKNKNW